MKQTSKLRNKKATIFLAILTVLVLSLVAGLVVFKIKYENNLTAISSVSRKIPFNIENGTPTSVIATELKQKNVIKSDWAFELYIRNNKSLGSIQAGQYLLDQNQSVAEIAKIITSGKVATDLVTILPARNLEQIKQNFVKSGYTAEEVEKALNPDNYSSHPSLVDKPKGASLEGYLFPETFQTTANTTLEDVIKMSLDELNKKLTKEVIEGFKKQGLNIHQALSLGSIVENESATADDRAKVASVFLNRLAIKMRLESNATDEYSASNPGYDTYKIDGLPPGPISNVSQSTIQAVANPSKTDYLFFVTADDLKTTYFSKTAEEHASLVREYCKLNCAPH